MLKRKVKSADAMVEFANASPFKEVMFNTTWKLGVKRMDNDYLYVGQKDG